MRELRLGMLSGTNFFDDEDGHHEFSPTKATTVRGSCELVG